MKESLYNIYNEECKLIYNSLTGAMAKINEDFYKLLQCIHNSQDIPLSLKEVCQKAQKCGFIVEDSFDEKESIVELRNKRKERIRKVALTIAPTLACNFRCIYCYEQRDSSIMSKSTQNAIISYLESKIKEVDDVSITWYGGEPLLCKKIIFELSEKILAICQSHGVKYHASMVTNGSLIDNEIVEKMATLGLKSVQITIDGTQEIHNSRRPSPSIKDTFSLIVKNINTLLNNGRIKVNIRVNIDKTNIDGITNLIILLSEKLVNKNVKISFGKVTPYTQICKSIENTCFNVKEYAEVLVKSRQVIDKYFPQELNTQLYLPRRKHFFCGAELENSYVIDPNGNLYKCWNVIGQEKYIIGNIKNWDSLTETLNSEIWTNRDPTKEKKCSNCKVLPLCMGGCRHMEIENKGHEEYICNHIKYTIKSEMQNYFTKFSNL